MGVRYLELGVEIVDDRVLQLLRKPYQVKHLNPVCDLARKLGITIIPNLIMGIPETDYTSTISWIRDNKDLIPMVNIYFLSDYDGKHSDLPVKGVTENDRNENSLNKSWLTVEDIIKIRETIREIFLITSGFELEDYEK